jgi:hypothetical protein
MSKPQKEHTIGELYTSMTGAGHGHDEQPVGPPPAPVVGVGHEPDDFNARPILTVPVFIGVVMVCAFGIATGMFVYFRGESAGNDGNANPVAKDRNDKPIDERFARISSSDPKAEVKQPRLEWLRQTDSMRDGKEDPPFLRSVRFAESGNSPEYRPEDLRPDNYVDPITRQKVLRDYGWVNQEKGVARIPVSVAMKLLIEKNALPVQANVSVPATGTATKPKLSNGGNERPAKDAKDVAAKTSKADAPKADKKDH